MGILYLTNAPKLVPATPTPNAKKTENKKQNNINGCFVKSLMIFKGLVLINKKIIKIIKIVFSAADMIIVGLPTSHKKGLKMAVNIANGARLIKLVKLPSSSPI